MSIEAKMGVMSNDTDADFGTAITTGPDDEYVQVPDVFGMIQRGTRFSRHDVKEERA